MIRAARAAVTAIVAAVLLTGSLTAAEAEGLEKYFPEDAILFYRFDNIPTSIEQYSNVSFQGLYEEEQMQAFLEGIVTKLREDLTEATEEAGVDLGVPITLEGLQTLLPQSFALALERPKGGTFNTTEDAVLVLAAEAGEHAQTYAKALDALAKENGADIRTMSYKQVEVTGYFVAPALEGADEKNVFNYAIADGMFFGSTKASGLGRLITAHKEGNPRDIAQDAHYQRLKQSAPPEATTFLHFDAQKLRSALPAGLATLPMGGPMGPGGGPGPQITGGQIYDALGLGTIRSLGAWWAIDKAINGVRAEMLLYAPGPKKGLLKLINRSTGPMTIPDYLPEETVLYEAVRLSPEQVYQVLMETIETVAPGQSALVQMMMAQVQQNAGIDVPGQAIPSIGDEHAFAIVPPPAGQRGMPSLDDPQAEVKAGMQMGKSILFIVEVQQEDAFAQTLDTVSAMAGGGGKVNEEITPHQGAEIHTFGPPSAGPMPTPRVSYVIHDGRFFLALDVDLLKRVVSGSGKSMGDQPIAREALQQVAAEKPFGLFAMDHGQYMAWYSDIAKFMMQLEAKKASGAGAPGGMPGQTPEMTPGVGPIALSRFIDFEKWPSAEIWTKYLGFAAGKATPIEDGFVLRTVYLPASAEE